MARKSWEGYFIDIAQLVSTRATCPRASVGAVLVLDKRIVSTGYNGAPPNQPHCIDEGCLMEEGHCQRVIHAEVNAIAQAARMGIRIEGATLYYYDTQAREVCRECQKVVKAAGIVRVVRG